jgi:hypothetical protein
MRPRMLFLVGLVLGAVTGLAFVLAGLRPRFASASGGLIGFGVAWLLVIAQSTWGCANDAWCSQVDVTPTIGFAAVLISMGIVLGLATWRHLTDRTVRREPH